MKRKTRILAINGSYRDDGITDQAVDLMIKMARKKGAKVEHCHLRDYPIEFCLNCRECTLHAGKKPGKSVQDDAMNDLVRKIEEADSFILASPTNFGSVTALFKRFMERLIVYAYWPWASKAPVFRKAKSKRKKAILISSSAAPGLMGRLFFDTNAQLKTTAKTIGADTVGTMFTGMIANSKKPRFPDSARKRAGKLVNRLI